MEQFLDRLSIDTSAQLDRTPASEGDSPHKKPLKNATQHVAHTMIIMVKILYYRTPKRPIIISPA